MARLKGSSIYESVISIAIISIVITVATYIIMQVIISSKPISYYQMIEKIEELKNNCDNEKNFTNKTFNFKEYVIEKKTKNYKDNPNLKILTFRILKDNHKIKMFNYLIRNK